MAAAKHPVRFTLAILSALALAACGSPGDVPVEVAVIGQASSPFESGARIGYPAQLVRAATTEGLVGFDEQGRLIPALADRWIVTDDGLSYIFRLRDGTWLDRTPLEADDAVAALRRALAALAGTPLAQDMAGIEAIIPRTGRVVEIQLSRPNPDLLQLLAQPELGLARKGAGAGPMRLAREDGAAVLSPISPKKRGLPEVSGWDERVRVLKLWSLSAPRAVSRFEAGDVAMVLGGRMESYPLAAGVGLTRGRMELDPVAGLFGLSIVTASGFLGNPENREALAMAIDRDAFAADLGANGWQPTSRIVTPGLPGDPGKVVERWVGQSIEARKAEAASRVTRWRAAQGAIHLRVALPAGPGADLLHARLARDLADIGIDVTRVGEAAPADLRLVDVVARYAGPGWFLSQLSCPSRGVPCSPEADRTAAGGYRATDPGERAALLADAEAQLARANVFIPLGPPLRWNLVRRDVIGFAANRWAAHPLLPLALLPR